MRRKDDSQMNLNLPTPAARMLEEQEQHRRPLESAPSDAVIYSFSDKKAARDNSEAARHFGELLQLVSHFK